MSKSYMTYRVKLYPTKRQEAALERHLVDYRVVCNWVIKKMRQNVPETGWRPFAFLGQTTAKYRLSAEICGVAARTGIASRIINDAIQFTVDDFFKLKKKGGPWLSVMKFKSARRHHSFSLKGDIGVKNGRLKLPKIEPIKMRGFIGTHAKVSKVTAFKRFDGWYAAITIEHYPIKLPKTGKVAGIDPGLSIALTLSDGQKIDFRRFYREQAERIGKLQRKSKNSKKLKYLHRKIKNRREDQLHKVSTALTREYDHISWSDDNIKGMMLRAKNGKRRRFGRSFADLGLAKFATMLEAKLASRKDGFVRVSSVNTTKACCACGALTGPSGVDSLSVREWTCESCGVTHDRDVNAAVNVLLSGRGASADKGKFVNPHYGQLMAIKAVPDEPEGESCRNRAVVHSGCILCYQG